MIYCTTTTGWQQVSGQYSHAHGRGAATRVNPRQTAHWTRVNPRQAAHWTRVNPRQAARTGHKDLSRAAST